MEFPGTGAAGIAGDAGSGSKAIEGGACVVCGIRDARLLVATELEGGASAILCGSHALLHGRLSEPCKTVDELRTLLADRREADRRTRLDRLDRDELAEQLTAAFTRERRSNERRAG